MTTEKAGASPSPRKEESVAEFATRVVMKEVLEAENRKPKTKAIIILEAGLKNGALQWTASDKVIVYEKAIRAALATLGK